MGVVCFAVPRMVCAATVTIFLEITGGLFSDISGNSPLVDGSVVYVIASDDNTADGMVEFGGAFIADSTQGDDLLVARIKLDSATIGDSADSGTHLQVVSATYDPATFTPNFVYLRFFNTLIEPPSGEDIPWGETSVIALEPFFGMSLATFSNKYETTNTSNFVVIPEPGTLNLILLAGGLLYGLYFRQRVAKQKKMK